MESYLIFKKTFKFKAKTKPNQQNTEALISKRTSGALPPGDMQTQIPYINLIPTQTRLLPWKWKWQSRLTLCDHMDYTVHGILQARILESVVFPFSRGSSQPRDPTQVSCIAGRFFTSWATREAQEYWSG